MMSRIPAAWQTMVLVGAIVLAGVLWQVSVPTGSDVSWLIDVANRMLAGDRLYVDVIESNPPVAVFLYMPAVLIEHATGLSAELAQIMITTAMAVASLAASASVLSRCGLQTYIGRFVVAGAFAFLILPRYAFSEREHLAIILILPMILLVFARQEFIRIPLMVAVAAGVAGGIGAAVKPYFVLLLLLPVLQSLALRRSLRPVLRAAELFVAAGVTVGFAVLTLVAFPAYLADIVPMETETYLQARRPLLLLLADPRVLALGFAAAAGYVALRRDEAASVLRTLLASAIAAIVIFLLQGKGWAYQLYPALTLVFTVYLTGVLPRLADALRAVRSGPVGARVVAVAPILGMVLLASLTTMCNDTYFVSMRLVPAVRAVAEHPRVFALSDDLGTGHPLVRSVGGTWVGRVCGQLIELAAQIRRAEAGSDATLKARMDHWIEWDRNEIRRALQQRPDVILVDHDTYDLEALTAARPDIAADLAGYTKTASAGTVDLLVRRDLAVVSKASEPVQ